MCMVGPFKNWEETKSIFPDKFKVDEDGEYIAVLKSLSLHMNRLISPVYYHFDWTPGTLHQSHRESTSLYPHEITSDEINWGFHSCLHRPHSFVVEECFNYVFEGKVRKEHFVACGQNRASNGCDIVSTHLYIGETAVSCIGGAIKNFRWANGMLNNQENVK